MIFRHFDLIDRDFGLFLVLTLASVFALIAGIAFHEACHAFMATKLGDTLPRRQGRVTLNPFAHLDPAGTMMMLFIGFGWGKPVMFNPLGLKMSPKVASFFVSLAGPASNFVMAGLLAVPIQLGLVPYIDPFTRSAALLRLESTSEYIGLFISGALYLNVILGVFNLIPIPPLDGFKVALVILPDNLAEEFVKLDRYGFGVLMVLLFAIPFLTGYSPVFEIMAPTARWLIETLTGNT